MAAAGGMLGAVPFGDRGHLRLKAVAYARWEKGRPIVLALAAAHHDLAPLEVDILDPDRQSLLEAEAAAVKELAEEAERRLQSIQERDDFAPREDRREMMRPSRPLQVGEPGHVEAEHAAVQEDESAEGLVLGGGGDPALDGEMIEECGGLVCTEGAGVTATVEGDERAGPLDVSVLGARRVVQPPDGLADGLDEGARGRAGGDCGATVGMGS